MLTQVSITPDKPIRQGKQKAKYQRCQDPACTGIQASFGYAHDKKRIRCATHKKEGMVHLMAKLCEEPTCKKRALYGQPNTKVSDIDTACPAFFWSHMPRCYAATAII
jgi:EsV-1-7 cysteine-rich motif